MYKLSSNRKYLINYVKNDGKDGIDHRGGRHNVI